MEKIQFIEVERFSLELLDNCLSASTNRELTKNKVRKDHRIQPSRTVDLRDTVKGFHTSLLMPPSSGSQRFKDLILVHMYMCTSLLQNAAHLQFLSCIWQSENEDLHHEPPCFYLSSYLHTYKNAGNTTLMSWFRSN